MKTDSKYYFLILFILSFSLYYSLSNGTVSEDGYKELLMLKIGSQHLGTIRFIIPFLFFLSAAMVFKTFNSENILGQFLVSILFILSPLVLSDIAYSYSLITAMLIFLFTLSCFLFFHFNQNIRYIAIIPLLVGLYLLYPFSGFSFSLAKIKDIGLLFPLSSIAFVPMINDKPGKSLLLFFIALFFSVFYPAISLVFLSFSILLSINIFFKHFNDLLYWTILVLFLSFYLFFNPSKDNYISAIGFSLAFSLIAYFILPLLDLLSSKFIRPFAVLLIVLAFTNTIILLEQKQTLLVSNNYIYVFKGASSLNGSFGVLDYPYSFEYYSGKKPKIINGTRLLDNTPLDFDYILVNSKSLDKELESRPIIFTLFDVSSYQNIYVGSFINKNYLLRVPMSADLQITGDGVMNDLNSGGSGVTVSFPKLKYFNPKMPFSDENKIINTENIADTNIYYLLFKKSVILEAEGIKLIKS